MKKPFKVVVSLLLVVATCFLVLACSKPHEHTWDEGSITIAATCNSKGLKTYKCSGCNETKTEIIEIDSDNHIWNSGVITTEATCGAKGVKTYTCARCNKTKTEEISIDSNHHHYDSGVITTEAICSAKGVKTYTCDICHGTKIEEIEINPDAHHFAEEVILIIPTCTTKGLKSVTCEQCHLSQQQEIEIDSNNHAWDSGVITTESTCNSKGAKTYTCSRCGGTKIEEIEINPEHHHFDEGKITTPATCTSKGVKTYTCDLCKTTKTEDVDFDLNNHNWNEGVVTKEPTYSIEGEKTYTCNDCHQTKVEKIEKVAMTYTYTRNATLIEGMRGVYEVSVVVGDTNTGDNIATMGIPSVAKQNLENGPTLESPAIIMGAAVGYEIKIPGQVAYTKLKERISPYDEFGFRIINEVMTNADGYTTSHRKLSGFDGSYYIIRVDVSQILAKYNVADLDSLYLHIKQENNKATMVMAGVLNGIDTGVVAETNADKTYKNIPTIVDGYWYFGENHAKNNTFEATDKQIFVDWFTGNWTINGTGFADGLGGMSSALSLKNNAELLRDTKEGKPYVDIILMSSGLLTNGADTGASNLSNDIKLSFYVDNVLDYNPELVYSYSATVVNDAAKLLAKYYDETKLTDETKEYAKTSYLVKAGDLEIDVAVDDNDNNELDQKEYWSLRKAFNYEGYNDHTIKLICEVPLLEGLALTGTQDNPRNIVLDVNSFDIQVANHNVVAGGEGAAAITVDNYATLTLTDNTGTYGAELAIGNNASMVIKNGGTLIIDESCTLEVEYDAASVNTQNVDPQQSQSGVDLSNGVITIEAGGKMINYGVITIEGIEFKPVLANEQTIVIRNIKTSALTIMEGAVLDNYGSMGVKGVLYVFGTLNNYGKYNELITAGDPDKGYISHHKGIQLTWKDNVTNDTPVSTNPNRYEVNAEMEPGKIYLGIDENNEAYANAVLNNYGDIVLVPGKLYLGTTLNNKKNTENNYSGHIYLCPVTEVVIPIVPSAENPTQHEERRVLVTPYLSEILPDQTKINNEEGAKVEEATIAVDSNGVLGKIAVTA